MAVAKDRTNLSASDRKRVGVCRESRHHDDLSVGPDRREGQGQLYRLHQRSPEKRDRHRLVSAECIRYVRYGGRWPPEGRPFLASKLPSDPHPPVLPPRTSISPATF